VPPQRELTEGLQTGHTALVAPYDRGFSTGAAAAVGGVGLRLARYQDVRDRERECVCVGGGLRGR